MATSDPTPPPIGDDEIVYRRIPPGSTFVKPGPAVTSANFKPRAHLGETSISVNRASSTSPERLLAMVDDEAIARLGPRTEWLVAAARAGDIRGLGFNVVPNELPYDPGHALITSATESLLDQAMQRKLARLFQFVAEPDSEP